MPPGIVYPQGCRPVQEELGTDELIRRLKVRLSLLATVTLQILGHFRDENKLLITFQYRFYKLNNS